MNVDFIIVGQGIAGTLISYELYSKGYSFVVIDSHQENSASQVAGAVLNPVIFKGRKNDDQRNQQIKIAVDCYERLGELIGLKVFQETALIRFASSEGEFEALQKSLNNAGEQRSATAALENETAQFFFNKYGHVIVSPVWKVDNASMLSSWRSFLKERNLLVEEKFDYTNCDPGIDSIQYRDLRAQKIIFCEGVGVRENTFIKADGFVKNRGDVLILRIPGLQTKHIFQKEYRLIPIMGDLFWMGSNYRWDFTDLSPDTDWRKKAEQSLANWLKLPYQVEAHLVAERPTTAGQRIFASRVTGHRNLFWLNGLGTKGFTIAPAIVRGILPALLQ